MKVNQLSITQENWKTVLSSIDIKVSLFLLFVSPKFALKNDFLRVLKKRYPKAIIMGCSTAGEISGVTVKDKTIALTAVEFDKIELKKVAVKVGSIESSYDVGVNVANKLYKSDLKHIIVFSDGLNVNGSDLVAGLKSRLPEISITGGLAGDGADFVSTFVVDEDKVVDKMVIGLGLYGNHVKVGFGAKGGWDSYGIERLVTKSSKNVLFELDGIPALDVYRPFLGEEALGLPSSRLLFPLSMRENGNAKPLVRSILKIDEETKSLTFAGNIPKGSYVRLMKGNIDRLINGAEESAIAADRTFSQTSELAILVSCVGRRLVLKQMVEEEVEVVRDVLGVKPKISGFYSYGEIGPHDEFSESELHNKTITITTLSEC